MDIIDWTGFIGISMILLAYFLNLKNKLNPEELSYILLNLVGASLACLASVLMKYVPFIILEGVWTIVSLQALWTYFKNK